MPSYWTPKDYTKMFLYDEPTHTEAEIRAEYSRMRDVAYKRAANLSNIGYSAQADYLKEIFPTFSEMENIRNRIIEENKTLPAKKQKKVPTTRDFVYRGSGVLRDKAYSVKGIKDIQRHIKDETGEVVPLGDVLGFNDYMKSWRLSAFSALIVPSGEAATLYPEEYQEIGGSFANFYTLYQELG